MCPGSLCPEGSCPSQDFFSTAIRADSGGSTRFRRAFTDGNSLGTLSILPAEIRNHIFELVFTTCEQDQLDRLAWRIANGDCRTPTLLLASTALYQEAQVFLVRNLNFSLQFGHEIGYVSFFLGSRKFCAGFQCLTNIAFTDFQLFVRTDCRPDWTSWCNNRDRMNPNDIIRPLNAARRRTPVLPAASALLQQCTNVTKLEVEIRMIDFHFYLDSLGPNFVGLNGFMDFIKSWYDVAVFTRVPKLQTLRIRMDCSKFRPNSTYQLDDDLSQLVEGLAALGPGNAHRRQLDGVWGLKDWVKTSLQSQEISADVQFLFVNGEDVLTTIHLPLQPYHNNFTMPSYREAILRGDPLQCIPAHIRKHIFTTLLLTYCPELRYIEVPDTQDFNYPSFIDFNDTWYIEGCQALIQNATFTFATDASIFNLMVFLNEFPDNQGFDNVVSLEFTELALFERAVYRSSTFPL
ncbi:hypothetical protein K491DRAFT_684369 [Lophiostoma macrostomum CBS 122681]|uniref:F-box domain-containing protein n=1 Tax=Lophiostoma macrostomum CBS 122681 TaxID=1314788 RepID=A0A6A6SLY3_9PLEO|nr:hypothetical protein K491DRAFT_684369 [Lophiostoma macrostomum CBS 122681]